MILFFVCACACACLSANLLTPQAKCVWLYWVSCGHIDRQY